MQNAAWIRLESHQIHKARRKKNGGDFMVKKPIKALQSL